MKLARTGGLMAVIALIALFLIPTMADARFGKGGFGSRGSKTFSAPPSTRTAPNAVQPIQRSAAPRTSIGAGRAVTKPGMFGGMSKGGFMAGLLGAGALGLLFGYGLSGGLGGLGAILGLVAQFALIGIAAMLLFSWLQRRKQPERAPALARSNDPRSRYAKPPEDYVEPRGYNSMASNGASAGGGSGQGAEVPTRPLQLQEEDFSNFERLLGEVQDAYAREDMTALQKIATEEMCGYFGEDIEDNKQQGQAIKISGVKLLQGDLAEAWKEPDAEYASVAMRFELKDAVVDRTSGKVIDGSLTDAQELTEVWTFVRRPSGKPSDWQLTAVQPEGEEEGQAA